MIENIHASFAYSSSSRFIQLAFSDFQVIEQQFRKIKFANFNDMKLVSASVKLDDTGIQHATSIEDGTTEEEYKNSHFYMNGKAENAALFVEVGAPNTFIMTGHIFAPIITSISVYKIGYFYDSSNASTFYREVYNIISFPMETKDEPFLELNYLMFDSPERRRATLSKHSFSLREMTTIANSSFKNFINIKRNMEKQMYARVARVDSVKDSFVVAEFGEEVEAVEYVEISTAELNREVEVAAVFAYIRYATEENEETSVINDIMSPLLNAEVFS